MNIQQYLLLFCGISFLAYGYSCLSSKHMELEFRRYGLSKYRKLTGALQLLAACGLFVGIFSPSIGGLAAAGLALQMACGLGVRIKIADPWYLCLPTGVYMFVCGWLAVNLL